MEQMIYGHRAIIQAVLHDDISSIGSAVDGGRESSAAAADKHEGGFMNFRAADVITSVEWSRVAVYVHRAQSRRPGVDAGRVRSQVVTIRNQLRIAGRLGADADECVTGRAAHIDEIDASRHRDTGARDRSVGAAGPVDEAVVKVSGAGGVPRVEEQLA